MDFKNLDILNKKRNQLYLDIKELSDESNLLDSLNSKEKNMSSLLESLFYDENIEEYENMVQDMLEFHIANLENIKQHLINNKSGLKEGIVKNKQILLEKYIKVAIRKQLKEQELQHKQAEKALYLAYRFPHLREMLEDLMSPVFGRYLKNITVVAPKPTTFKIELINNQEFNIIYIGKKRFTIKIAGKKYNPDNLGELERASQSIADLLQLNYAPEEGKDQHSQSQQDDLKNDLENASSPSTTSGVSPSEPEQTPVEEPIDNEEPAEEEAETVKI